MDIHTLSRSVVTLVCFDGRGKAVSQGTGFVVDERGTVVTNWHVIENAANVVAIAADGTHRPAPRLLNVDKDQDVALLRFGALDNSPLIPPLKLGLDNGVVAGTPVITITTPQGLQHTVSDGLIAAVRDLKHRRLLQITAPISPGSSGGPVLSQAGEVIGIVVGQLETGQNLNFAIPISVAQRLLVQLDSTVELKLPAWPEDPVQREFSRHYDAGLRAYKKSEYRKAATLFAKAQRLRPDDWTAHWAAAVAWDKANHLESAEGAYRKFLASDVDDQERVTEARARLADIEAAKRRIDALLGKLRLQAILYFLHDGSIQGFVSVESKRVCSVMGNHAPGQAGFTCTDEEKRVIWMGWDGDISEGSHTGEFSFHKAGDFRVGPVDMEFWISQQ